MILKKPISLIFIGFLFLSLLVYGCGRAVSSSSSSIAGKISGDFTGCATGAFVVSVDNISTFESDTNKELAIVNIYLGWYNSFPIADCDTIRSHGSIPMITWEPWLTGNPSLETILTGEADSYITSFAIAAKTWKHRLFIRPMHEMNGSWYPWDGYHNGAGSLEYGSEALSDGPERFIEAWQRIHDIFQSVGAKNVTFVWAPNHRGSPINDGWNAIDNYYPGDAYVDWIGIDGYNWDGSGAGSWETFSEIFNSPYSILTGAHPTKPLMIGEFACAQGIQKPDWIIDAFTKIKSASYDDIKAFVWFNENKEADWRVDSSPASLASYKAAMSDSYFIESIP